MSERVKGATSVSLFFRLTDSTTGAAKSGLDVTTLKLQYARPGAANGAATSLTLLAALTTAWTSYGAKEIDATNSKGVYRVDAPDLAFATGADEVALTVTGTGIEPATRLIDLTAFDARDAVRGALTSLPNVASGSAGAIPTTGAGANQISVSSGQVILQAGAGTGQLDFTNGVVKSNATQWLGGTIPAANVAGVPLVDLKYTLGTLSAGAAGYIGPDWGHVNAPTTSVNLSGTTISTGQVVASVSGTVGSVTGAVGSVTGAVGSVVGNVGGNVVGSVASVTAAVTLSAGDSPVMQSGTATAGGASTITIQTALGADALPVGCTIKITSGTGAKQARVITAYVDSTKVTTVDRAWTTSPDATSVYSILYTDLAKTDSSLQVTAASVQGNVTGSVGSVVGAVGSVTGAVGSVAGNVGGNVVGSVASVTGAVGSVAGNVTGSVGSVVGAVGSVTGAVGSVTGAVGSVAGNVGGNVVGTVASVVGNVGGNVVGSVASVTAGVALTAGERNSVADALLDRADAIETGLTPRGAFRLCSAASAGVLSGAATTTVVINNAVQNSKPRLTATVDASGNRSAIVTDVS